MSGPRCNLPDERHEEILKKFDGVLSADEENEIRDMFPQYLFFRNEYTDDGWEVSSSPVRLCTCTACRETFEAVRGNYPRGKLHGEPCNCPKCGRQVEGRAVHKYKYDMKSLKSWVKTAVLRVQDDGALLIEAGDAFRRFNWDDLTGEILWQPVRRYYIKAGDTRAAEGVGPYKVCGGVVQEWYHKCVEWGFDWDCGMYKEPKFEWMARKTAGDAFNPVMYSYNGAYRVVGLENALRRKEWKYCQIQDFYTERYGADIVGYTEGPLRSYIKNDPSGMLRSSRVPGRQTSRSGDSARWIVPYLAWYAMHPQIEMAVKLGFSDAVEELIEYGKKNARLLNWNTKTPKDFLKLRAEDVKTVLRAGIGLDGLKKWKERAGGLSFSRYMEIVERVGKDNMSTLCACAQDAGCSLQTAAHYVERLRPPCPQYGVPLGQILGTWSDYLSMARRLGYDLKEKTVAMPKDLQERHDRAAETIKVEGSRDEMKRYRRRRRMLEKKYGFALGKLRVVIPVSSAEIVQEGKTLHHCVGGYAARHIEGKTTILFIRRRRTPGRSFLTVELYEERGKIKIRQVHGYRNEGYAKADEREAVRPATRYAWFLDAWLGWVNDGSPRDKAGNPVLPGTDKEKEKAV